MTRSSHRGGFPQARRDKANAAIAKREQLLAQLRQKAERQRLAAAVSPETPSDRLQRFAAVVADLPLRLPDGAPTRLSPAYREIVTAYQRVLITGQSEAMLCWPARNISIAATYSLAVLAAWQDSVPDDGPPSTEQRTLYFPWSTRTRIPLRHLHVCRSFVSQTHLRLLQRLGTDAPSTNPFFDLHTSMLRVRDLNGQVVGGRTHSEYLNPTLEELVPSGPCDGEPASTLGLLYRSRRKTQLSSLSSGHIAGEPASAPHFLYGLHAKGDLRKALRHLPPFHIALLDCTRTARNRLTPDWRPHVNRFLRELRARRPGIPVLAITDDPWVHRELIWGGLKEFSGIKGKKPARNSAAYTATNTLAVGGVPQTTQCSGETNIDAVGFAGNLDSTLDAITDLKAKALRLEDASAAAALDELALILRRCAALPGSVAHLGTYVADEAGDVAAINIMQAYQAPRILASIQALEGPLAQSRREELSKLSLAARAAWQAQSERSPMHVLLKEILSRYIRSSSKTVILLRNSMMCDYALFALSNDSELGAEITGRIEKKMFLFIDEVGLRETTGLPPRERHQIRTLIHVSPTREQVLANMTLPWLPHKQIILAEARTLAGISRDAAQLAAFPSFSVFADRLRKLATACQAAADSVSGVRVVLGPTDPPADDIDFPSARIIDLAGSGLANEPLIKIETENRQTVIARRRTRLLTHDSDSAIPSYRSVNAEDLEIGDAVCIINDDFVDMARQRLDIVHTANEVVREYHQLILALFSALPGPSDRARRIELAQRITTPEREVDEGNVRYWVDLAEELTLPLEEVTPHAPKDHPTFLRLTRALGINDAQAEKYWKWAVIATRSHRLKAAHRLYDAYTGILVSPHSAEAENPKRVEDIRALRAAAERFITKVTAKTTTRRAELCK